MTVRLIIDVTAEERMAVFGSAKDTEQTQKIASITQTVCGYFITLTPGSYLVYEVHYVDACKE